MKRILKAGSKVLDMAFNVLTVVAVAMLISLVVTKLTTGTASFFGCRPLHVMSASMEPTIMTGDIVIGKVADRENIHVGGIYTYTNDYSMGKTIIHRISDKTPDGKFVFWGDNNEAPDRCEVDPSEITYEVIWYPNMTDSKEAENG